MTYAKTNANTAIGWGKMTLQLEEKSQIEDQSIMASVCQNLDAAHNKTKDFVKAAEMFR